MGKPCFPQFGFVGSRFTIGKERQYSGVGDDCHSWAVDGERSVIWHKGPNPWTMDERRWMEGDVIGLAWEQGMISVSLNGNWFPSGPVVRDVLPGVEVGHCIFPAFSAKNISVRCNFGSESFKYKPLWSLLNAAVMVSFADEVLSIYICS